jgi:integrase/recombinase XerD
MTIMPTTTAHSTRPPSPQKGRRYSRTVLSEAEVRQLLRVCSSRSRTGVRMRALITLMWVCGLRISEAVALKSEDIDRDRREVHVLFAKGSRRRTLALTDEAILAVDRWLDYRRAAGLRSRFLFCTGTGQRLHHSAARRTLHLLGRRAGMAKRVHTHSLRHSAAMALNQTDGVRVTDIQRQLGHARLETTAVYLGEVSIDRLHDVTALRFGRPATRPAPAAALLQEPAATADAWQAQGVV